MLLSNFPGLCTITNTVRHYSSMQELFVNPRIHNLLRLVTCNDPLLVHKPRYRNVRKSFIQLLTDAELKTVREITRTFTDQKLQMPPVLEPRIESKSMISVDKNLQGLFPSNYRLVFTDTTLKYDRKGRLIVVREPSGVLRHATSSERDRMNQLYFPLPGRCMHIPAMFEDRHLDVLLEKGSFLYILDKTCVQFEPNDPMFIHVCHRVYDALLNRLTTFIQNSAHSNDSDDNPLKSFRNSRHYGPFVLYVINKYGNSCGLIYEALICYHFARVGWLLRLHCLIRPDCRFCSYLKAKHKDLPPPAEVDFKDVDVRNSSNFRMDQDEIEKLIEYIRSFVKEAVFYLSTAYVMATHRLRNRPWYSRINNYVVLGALPLKKYWQQLEADERITHVISMLEPFEVKSFVMNQKDLEERGLKYLSLPVRDFVGYPSIEQINTGIAFIRECARSDGCVYIHCKAGRTRSAFLLACYIIHEYSLSAEESIDRIRKYRPHITFFQFQIRALCQYAKTGTFE